MSEIITVGLDLAKNVFQVHGADASGWAVLRKKLKRERLSCSSANSRIALSPSEGVLVRLDRKVIAAIDAQRRREPGIPARPEMIRRMINQWLEVHGGDTSG